MARQPYYLCRGAKGITAGWWILDDSRGQDDIRRVEFFTNEYEGDARRRVRELNDAGA